MRETKKKISIAREKLKEFNIEVNTMKDLEKEKLIVELLEKDIRARKEWYMEKINEVEKKGHVELNKDEDKVFNKFSRCKSDKFRKFTKEEEKLFGDIFIYGYIRNNLDFFKELVK